ncbi:CBS domain-containing protein [Chitinispirillales bacterium ANBcel5]|uniref:CBS domain-containing protein n=1 Tax=Cellulosispirillum alkaliphilum TaxID=3039283 RepID=UPI002A55AE7B|nr:CBS domain-containing protein [Chitinispirillales bacterium ANBcel5]
MRVEEIMTHGVDFANRTDSVQEVAKKMQKDNVGALPVFDGNFAVGIITDRDIAVRLVAKGLDSTKTSVSQIMTRDVYFCSINDTVEEAAKIMETKQVRRLLVKNEYDHVTGLVSIADIARADGALTARILLKVTTPAQPSW